MANIGGFGKAQRAGLAGIRNAQSRLASSASKVNKATAEFSKSANVSVSPDARALVEADLIGATADRLLAQTEMSASVAVLEAVDEATEELLKLGRDSDE